MEWTLFDRDDDNTYPPSDHPLFIAYREDGMEMIVSGMYVETDYGCCWFVQVDDGEDSNLMAQLSSRQVVGWIAAPVEFPKEVQKVQMKKYEVAFTQITNIEVEAESEEEAIRKAIPLYEAEKCSLVADTSYDDVEVSELEMGEDEDE